MSDDTEQLKKKIIYRSSYRGTKEMDILLSSFVNEYIDKLNLNDLYNLYEFLKIDDVELYNIKNYKLDHLKIKKNKIFNLYKNYKFVKK
jgi:antitoxin CptB